LRVGCTSAVAAVATGRVGVTKKQEAMKDQPRGRLYAGFNERWDEKHPPVVEQPQEEQLFNPDEEDE